MDSLKMDALRKEIGEYCGLADRVIHQTRRRVLNGEPVPTDEKLYSIFEPHTDLIKRGKARKPVEFGRKVFLAESAQGLITEYKVLEEPHTPAGICHPTDHCGHYVLEWKCSWSCSVWRG